MGPSYELHQLAAAMTKTLKRRLVLWTARWTIGFGIIAVVLHYRPAMTWLWWAGGAIAALSLVSMVIAHAVLRRRLDASTLRAAGIERTASDAELQ